MQGVHSRYGSRTHGEDVAQDAANACSRALVRLYKRRVIVRFNFENGSQASTYVNDASVFARSVEASSPRKSPP